MTLKNYLSTNDMSVYHEKMIEHYFIAELIQALAVRHKKLECLASRTGDSFGYDLVLICDGVSKYIQLKTLKGRGSRKWKVHQALMANNPHEFEFIVIYISYDTTGDKMLPLNYKYLNKTISNNNVSFPLLKTIKNKNIIQPSHLTKNKIDIFNLSLYLFP